MPSWLTWLLVVLLAWAFLAVAATVFVARLFKLSALSRAGTEEELTARPAPLPRRAQVAAPSAPARPREL